MSSILYPTTNLLATEQLTINRGQGIYVYDQQGKQYIEGLAGLWCTALGYGNQELIETASAQMSTMAFGHLFGGRTHEMGMALADRLAAMVPIDRAHVFFGNSGSDANDTQIKLLRYYFAAIGQPQKRKIISRDRAYHGVTVAAASLTGIAANHSHFDLPLDALGILRTDAPHYYRNGLPGETEVQFVDRLAANLEALIEREGAETIACFVAEPVMGAGGVVVPPAGYFDRVQAILRAHDILFLDDEVICGFGRTGEDFGATTYGLQPDMMSLAKALSSAYFPISAAVIKGELYDALVQPSADIGVFGHGYTYSGHPVGCAVALKTLEIYQRDNLFQHAAKVGAYFQRQLQRFADHPLVGEVRGVGLIAALELVADKATDRPFQDGAVGAYCYQRCLDAGLIVRAVAGNSIALCPPLIITQQQVDELMDKLSIALHKTTDFVTQQGTHRVPA